MLGKIKNLKIKKIINKFLNFITSINKIAGTVIFLFRRLSLNKLAFTSNLLMIALIDYEFTIKFKIFEKV